MFDWLLWFPSQEMEYLESLRVFMARAVSVWFWNIADPIPCLVIVATNNLHNSSFDYKFPRSWINAKIHFGKEQK